MWSNLARVIVLLLAVATLSACVSNQAFRSFGDGDKDVPSVINIEKNATLFVIEFDDQGRFFEKKQFTKLKEKLKSIPYESCTNMLVFIHGWRHNAENGDDNLRFSEKITKDTYDSMTSRRRPECNGAASVIGVYLSWRGKSATTHIRDFTYDPLEILSFWDRKSSAERVSTGSIRQVLAYLAEFKRHVNAPASAGGDAANAIGTTRARLIMLGHSMGGLILFNAVSETLIREVTMLSEEDWKPQGPDGINQRLAQMAVADLVVLVNPAIEGAAYEPLHQALIGDDSDCGRGRPEIKAQLDHPLMIQITSDNDFATGVTFPFGRLLDTPLESTSPQRPAGSGGSCDLDVVGSQEAEASLAAMGHIRRYQTHFAKLVDYDTACKDKGPHCDHSRHDGGVSASDWKSVSEPPVPGDDSKYVRYIPVHNDGKRLIEIRSSYPRSPIWMMQTDQSVLDGHNGFGGEIFIKLIDKIYRGGFKKNIPDERRPSGPTPPEE
jgi:pimeloyl-ACP methyl ester carboxylesterase